MSKLKNLIENYSPSFVLPHYVFQLYKGQKYKLKELVKFDQVYLALPDEGEILLEWFPLNYNEMSPETPVVVFLLGAVGDTTCAYAKQYALMVKNIGWRMMIINRRGFGNSHLKSKKFFPVDEYKDIEHTLLRLKEIYSQAPLYMCGVSAGGNFGLKYLGSSDKQIPVECFVSIGNPFNIGQISFNMQFDWIARIFSKLMTSDLKKLYEHHSSNPLFMNLINDHFNEEFFKEKIGLKKTTWEFDEFISCRLGKFENVLDYYYHISCENVLENVKIPVLVINSKEDPISKIEAIPFDKLNKNENFITLVTDRGGHIEFFEGWDLEWWAFKVSLEYFKHWEEKKSIKVIQ